MAICVVHAGVAELRRIELVTFGKLLLNEKRLGHTLNSGAR
jgi:hypothetical protein